MDLKKSKNQQNHRDLDLVDEMMKANRINQETHPIMHEYFATEEFH